MVVFFVKLSNSSTHSLALAATSRSRLGSEAGKSVALNFFVVQSVLDSSLFKLFPLILGCGSYSDNSKGNTVTFSV